MTERSGTLVIMANGPSLSKLSASQKERIRCFDSLAMNLYACHMDQIGIVPQHYLLLDHIDGLKEAFSEACSALKQPIFKNTNLWLSSYWFSQLALEPNARSVKLFPWTKKKWPEDFCHQWLDPRSWFHNIFITLDRIERRLTKRTITNTQIFRYWHWFPFQRIFNFRSTLVVGLGLAWRLGYKKVVLVGVDLKNCSHFYQADPRVVDFIKQKQVEQDSIRHCTASWYRGVPPVQEAIARIARIFRFTGRSLVCANPNSLLVEERIVEFEALV